MPIRRSLAAGLVLLALGGGASAQDKANAPIPAATLALMAAKGSSGSAPVVFRAYKRESELEVWKRDGGRCVVCGETDELQFDHVLPYALGGTSLTAENVQLLCARHNLAKGARLD